MFDLSFEFEEEVKLSVVKNSIKLVAFSCALFKSRFFDKMKIYCHLNLNLHKSMFEM
jgi:hypothetical protein